MFVHHPLPTFKPYFNANLMKLPVFCNIREFDDLVHILIWMIYLVLERLVLRQGQHLASSKYNRNESETLMPVCVQTSITASIPGGK